jgi:glycosyltransferase involved in cell wall biosynthesis
VKDLSSEALRLVIIGHTLDFRAGGAERVLHSFLSLMDPSGFHAVLAVPRQTEALRSDFGDLGCPLVELPPMTQPSGRSLSEVLRLGFSLLRLNLACWLLLRRERPDVVYVNSIFALHFAALPARICGVPLVYHEHNLVSQREASLWHRLFPRLVRSAARVIAISRSVGATLLHVGFPPERVEVVHNGIAPAPRSPESARDPASRQGFKIVQVANLHRWKGHETSLRALALLADRVPDARLVFHGRTQEADFDRELRDMASELGISDRVDFAGFVSDVEERLPGFDCLVVASYGEPFGLVVLEAMRAGIPVVGSRAGGVPEIIRHGENGLLFDVGDAEDLANCFERIAREPELARSLAESGLRTVREEFSAERQARSIEGVLERAAASTSSG